MKKVLKAVDAISEYSGRIASWLCVALVLVLAFETTARYVFNRPTIWAHVTATMLYGAIGMLGLAYTDLHNGHIRVDIIYNRLSARGRAILDMVMALIFLLPFLYIMLRISSMWMLRSIAQHEVMMESFWYPIASPFRSMIVVALALFTLQSLSRFVRDVYVLIRGQPYA